MTPPPDLDQLLIAAGTELPPPPAEVTDQARRAALQAAGIATRDGQAAHRRWPLILIVAAALVLLLGVGLAVASRVFDHPAQVVPEQFPNGPDPRVLR